MQTLVYDGSFAGWLSAVFDVYEYRYTDATIQPHNQRQDNLFGSTSEVYTDKGKAARVLEGLKKKVSKQAITQIHRTFLSEQAGMEDMLLQYVQYAFKNTASIETDYSHRAVLYVSDMAKKVHREKHRMEAFVRFQRTHDDLYYATVEPDFNVLPLIQEHFEKRYADQQWMIYDVKRKYGIYYNLHHTSPVQVDFNELKTKSADTVAIFNDTEEVYQYLWQQYFTNVNIKARKNLKLHIRHMPKRYWKYLTEKRLI